MFLLVIAVAGLIFWLIATQEKIASLRWRVERLEKRLEQQAPSVKPAVNAPASGGPANLCGGGCSSAQTSAACVHTKRGRERARRNTLFAR